jgi:hypothetical protein
MLLLPSADSVRAAEFLRPDTLDLVVADAAAGAGLDPVDRGPYLHFRHRVDQAVVREVLVARKPSSDGTGNLTASPDTTGT